MSNRGIAATLTPCTELSSALHPLIYTHVYKEIGYNFECRQRHYLFVRDTSIFWSKKLVPWNSAIDFVDSLLLHLTEAFRAFVTRSHGSVRVL